MSWSPKDLQFITDLGDKKTTHIKLLSSDIHRGAVIHREDIPLPEDYQILTAEDLPGKNRLTLFGESMPLLAEGEIHYRGQPLLLLHGPREREVAELARKIEFNYQSDETYTPFPHFEEDQVCRRRTITRGQPDKHMEKANRVISGDYYMHLRRQKDYFPVGAFARYERGGVTIFVATRWPDLVRQTVSQALGLAADKITVETPPMASFYNQRLWFPAQLAALTALAAQKTRHSARLILSRQEADLMVPREQSALIHYRTGISETGEIVAQEIALTVEAGAFPMASGDLLDRLCLAAAGPYSLSHQRITGLAIRTSRAPADYTKTLGFQQGFFGIENHLNRVARLGGKGPEELRAENILKKGDAFVNGWIPRRYFKTEELLADVIRQSDFSRKYAAYHHFQNGDSPQGQRPSVIPVRRGIALACAYQGNGFLGAGEEAELFSVSARLDKEGRLTIKTSAVPESLSTSRIWKKRAGEILQLDADQIAIEASGSGRQPNSGPSLFSRNITIITNLIERCCTAIKKSRFRSPLPIEVKRGYRLPKKEQWNPESFTGPLFPSLSWGTAVLELEANPITYSAQIRGIWLSINCGRVLDEQLARRELEAGIIRSLHDLMIVPEAVSSETPSLFMSRIPLYINFIENKREKPGGVSQLPDCLMPAAFTGALNQALNTDFKQAPLSPALIFEQEESHEI